jgi:hypothetical protein
VARLRSCLTSLTPSQCSQRKAGGSSNHIRNGFARNSFRLRGATCTDGGARPPEAELQGCHDPLPFSLPASSRACPSPVHRGFYPHDTSHQHNTHIRERREICYPWHPWHGRKVWVHTTLIKRGRAVAHCSLEDVQPFRVLEVPLWMLDVAVCCKIRVVKSGLANVESLRELRALLHSAQRARGDIALEAQHRYLLDAGGADVNVADSRGTPSTPVVCSSASQAALDGSVARCSTEDSAIADAVAAAALRQTPGRGPGRGGAR